MDICEARHRVKKDEFSAVTIVHGDNEMVIRFCSVRETATLHRARGERARFQSFDAAIAAIKRTGWDQEISVIFI